jgi:hypothetical protein
MSTGTIRTNKNLNTRRSQRLMLKMAVIVAGQKANGTNFAEQTTTAIVNAHGALVLLKETVHGGQLLRIRNVKTGDEQACKVIEVGGQADGKTEVGIEFLEPAPRFWRIAFPPEDWNVRNAEAKRFRQKPASDPSETRE